jgi:O-antigen/teichoic acid export membrane protein
VSSASPAPTPAGPSAGRVARSFLALGLGEALSRLIAFGATVYAARVLGAGGYGVVAWAMAVVLYFNRVVDAGFELGIGVREVAARPEFVAEGAATVLTFRTALAVILVTLVVAASLILLPEPDASVLAVQILTVLAVGISPRWVHLGFHRARLSASATAAGQLLMALLVLALVRSPDDLRIMPAAQVAGDLLAASILVVALRRLDGSLRVRVDWAVLRPLLPRSRHMVASGLLGIATYSLGVLFLRAFDGPASAGLYAAAYSLVIFFVNVGLMYSLSLLPTLTRLGDEPSARNALYATALTQVFTVAFPVAVGGALLAAPFIGLIYGPSYLPAAVAFGVLVWSIPCDLLRDVSIAALMSVGRERTVFRITVVSATTSLALGLLLVPRFGLVGAAAVTFAAELLRLVLALTLVRRSGFAGLPVGRMARPVAAGLAMGVVVYLTASLPVPLVVGLGMVAYALALIAVGGLRVSLRRWPELTV